MLAIKQGPAVTAPKSVVGFHGCTRHSAEAILADRTFRPSSKAYDWLGEGVYFWEYAPYRALEWAERRCAVRGDEPVVIRATISLGRCLNLLDREHIAPVRRVYDAFQTVLGDKLPRNTERGAHYLDRLVIDAYCRAIGEHTTLPIQTVRGSFAEGEPIFPGSKVLSRAHAQIAVRDVGCIRSMSLVRF
jgi:hypothetical protein